MDVNTQIVTLIYRTASGDREAFEKLITSHMDLINSKIRSMVSRIEDAEDICQKVVIRVYQKIGTLKYPQAFRSWLNTIVINECSRHFQKGEPVVSLEELSSIESYVSDADEDFLPAKYVERLERSTTIKAALERLPEISRKIILYYYADGMCYKDIAARMGISIGAVSVNLFRAKKRLHRYLLRA